MKILSALLLAAHAAAFSLLPASANEAEVTVETLTGYRDRFDAPGVDVEQHFVLIDLTQLDADQNGVNDIELKAVLVLFAGGTGKLGIEDGQLEIESTNFLVRNRDLFAAEGYHVAVPDAASDFLDAPDGLWGERVTSSAYLQDIAALIAALRAKFPSLPLWLVGTSRGTISAARGAAELGLPPGGPEGVVLTAPLTGPSGNGDLGGVAVESVKVPALIAANRDDGCEVTRPEDAKALKKRFVISPKVQTHFFKGGSLPLTFACGSLSPHGFFGIDQIVVRFIARWIAKIEE